jgi:hypothetical protein
MNINNLSSTNTVITEGLYYLCKCGELLLSDNITTMQCPCCNHQLYICPVCKKLNTIRREV